MTTNHVVADADLGLVARREWELHRRLLEGRLDPKKVAQQLQLILEDAALLPLERSPFTFSEHSYDVTVNVEGNLLQIAEAAKVFRNIKYVQELALPLTRESTQLQVRLLLARVRHDYRYVEHAITEFRALGYEPADAWEALAFAAAAPCMKLCKDAEIYCLGTESPDWGLSQEKGLLKYMYFRLIFECPDKDGRPSINFRTKTDELRCGSYVLLRAKS